MANNLRKFNTYSDYEAAELVKPAVSLIVATDEVYFDQKDAPIPPTPSFSGLTVYYNITDITQQTELFKYGGGSGSGSGSGSGGVLPSAMVIDGTEFYPTPTYQFDTVGEHIVQYSFVDNVIPEQFLDSIAYVTKVEIGDAITSIGMYAFNYCTGLTNINIPSGVTSISNSAFRKCSSLTSITIPNSVTSIGNSTFEGCSGLTSIVIPDSVTSIDGYAFQYCTNLQRVTFGSGLTTIGSSTFADCTSLTNIDIPSGVTSISNETFKNCSGLTSIVIPDSVTSISMYAFFNCNNLTSIVSNATTAPTILIYTFQNLNTSGTLTVPIGSTGYDVWMGTGEYYLGYYNWTKVEQ